LSCFSGIVIRQSGSPHSLDADTPQEIAIALGCFFGGAHTWQHVLFDDCPAIVVDFIEGLEDGGKINFALTQFAKQPLAHGEIVLPAFPAGLSGDKGIAIFKVNVPDTVGMSVYGLNRIAAAKVVMSRIQAEADQIRIGQLEQFGYFVGGFDPGGTVRMKDGSKSGLF
jgi:hypothetical protein